MKLVLPSVEGFDSCQGGVLRIAQTLGAECLPLPLTPGTANHTGELEHALAKHGPFERGTCIAINPSLIRQWLGVDEFPSALASCLLANFRFVLVHELDTSPISQSMVRILSLERLSCVRELADASAGYQVADQQACDVFANLNFGPAHPDRDRVFGMKPGAEAIKVFISVGGEPLFAAVKRDEAEIFFLAASPEIDIDSNLAGRKLSEYFSHLLPVAMFLRYAFGDECWRPAGVPHATLIIDDPPLWKQYGFLNYERLLSLMDRFDFHTTIAFIPYYWKRNSPATVRLFRERPDRFSLCFHGNDHTGGELAAQDSARLTYILRTAQSRMQAHHELTGIPCEKVMVFPQGRFSRNALQSLKEHNFVAAVNSGPSPNDEQIPLTVMKLMQPSILSYSGFPLFLRRYPRDFGPEYVAFDAFFGRPILIVEHHEIFKDPSSLLELVSLINQMVPRVRWRNLQTSLENACWVRRTPAGSLQVRAFAATGRITNALDSPLCCVAEWPEFTESSGPAVLVDGIPAAHAVRDDSGFRVSFTIAPHASRTVRLSYPNSLSSVTIPEPSLKYKMKLHARRRLSETRDNYLSKSRTLMRWAKSLRGLLFKDSHAPGLRTKL